VGGACLRSRRRKERFERYEATDGRDGVHHRYAPLERCVCVQFFLLHHGFGAPPWIQP
jgi:hypothetical protein